MCFVWHLKRALGRSAYNGPGSRGEQCNRTRPKCCSVDAHIRACNWPLRLVVHVPGVPRSRRAPPAANKVVKCKNMLDSQTTTTFACYSHQRPSGASLDRRCCIHSWQGHHTRSPSLSERQAGHTVHGGPAQGRSSPHARSCWGKARRRRRGRMRQHPCQLWLPGALVQGACCSTRSLQPLSVRLAQLLLLLKQPMGDWGWKESATARAHTRTP
jgi:hypothetical protein